MFLLHLFLLGGREESCIARSTNQMASLLRRTSAGSAGERALPRDTSPHPSSLSPSQVRFSLFFFSPFTICCLFSFLPLCAIVSFVLFITVILPPFSPTVLLSHHLIHGSQWKQAVIRSANEGFSHMAVTQSSRAKLCYFIFLSFLMTISQLCCVRGNSVWFCWLVWTSFWDWEIKLDNHIRVPGLWEKKQTNHSSSSFQRLCVTQLCRVTRNLASLDHSQTALLNKQKISVFEQSVKLNLT